MLKQIFLVYLVAGALGQDYHLYTNGEDMTSPGENIGEDADYGEEIFDYYDQYGPDSNELSTTPEMHQYNENKTVNLIHQHHEALVALLGSEESVYSSVYRQLHDPSYLDLAGVKMNIKQAVENSGKASRLSSAEKNEITELLAILDERMEAFLKVEANPWLTKTLAEQGENLIPLLPVNEVTEVLSELVRKAEEDLWDCDDGYLVNLWRRVLIQEDFYLDNENLNKALSGLVGIGNALVNSTYMDGKMYDAGGTSAKNKAQVLTMFSTKRNRIFANKALGSAQELEDLVQYILCRQLSLSWIDEILRKLTSSTDKLGEPNKHLLTNPEDISTLVGIQRSLGDITLSLAKVENTKSGRQRARLPAIGGRILNSYMDLVDNAVNAESAKIWAQMPLEEVNEKLHHILLSNENYVGTVSDVILESNAKGRENFTLDKKSVSITISRLNLEDKKAEAAFEFGDTHIRTDNMIEFHSDSTDGKDFKVYALRYKSWSNMIRDIMEKHFDIANANLTSKGHNKHGNHSRQARRAEVLKDDTPFDKSFIGKGGIISLSTRQNGVKRSVPVTFWTGFDEEIFTSNVSSRFHRCISCEYLEAKTVTWETVGCTVDAVDDKGVTCKCNHTTNFAAFMMPAEISYNITKEEETALRIMSIVGSCLSSIGLLFSLIIFYIVRNLVRNERLRAHANLSLALLAVHVIFLLGDLFLRDDTACVVSTVFSQYFLLASFMWMLIEGIFLYLYVVQVFLRSKIASYRWMYIVGWVVPIFIVAVSAAYGIPNEAYVMPAEAGATQQRESVQCPEGTVRHTFGSEIDAKTTADEPKYARCWLSTESGMIWSFLTPAILILAFNAIIMCKTLKICIESLSNSSKRGPASKSYVGSGKFTHSDTSSERHFSSCDHHHGKSANNPTKPTPSRPVSVPSPCLLQITTDEEEINKPAPDHGSDHSSSSSPSSNEHVPKTEVNVRKSSRQDDAEGPGVSTRYHSVSDDSRFRETRAVVYRNSIGRNSLQITKKPKSFGKKMFQFAHERASFFQDALTLVKGAMVLLPILGVPWVCGFLGHLSPVFTFLFVILNSTQGIAIFVVYCLFNGEVRRAIQRLLAVRSLKNSVDSGFRRTGSTSTTRSFLRFGRRRSTITAST